MTRCLSTLLILTIAWTSTVQAFYVDGTDITQLKEFGDHMANQGVNAAVKVGADLASTGKVNGTAVALGAVAGTIGSYLSTKIGDWHGGALNTAENELVHDVLHTLKGAGEGYIVGGEKGMAAGALGAFVAEKTAKFMMPTGGINREGAVNPKYTDDMKRKTMAIARLVTGMVAFSTGMSADQIGVAMLSANTSLDHNFAATAMRHAGIDVDVKDEIIDEDTLSTEARKNGISQEEINTVKTKLQNLAIENLGNAPTASDLITDVPTSPEAIEATQKSIIKGYVKQIATVNNNIHQVLKEHPWAEKTVTQSAQMFGNCVRAMLYIDMGILGASGGTGMCAAAGVKSIAGLRTCALAGGVTSLTATAFVIEPAIEAAIQEGVQYLSQQGADRFGDTPQEKAAIKQLVGDTANVAGLFVGAKYLHGRYNHVSGLITKPAVVEGMSVAEALSGIEKAEISATASAIEELSLLNRVRVSDAHIEALDLAGTHKGPYKPVVNGHHIHAKKAFEGHPNYDPKTGFSISNDLMNAYGVKHSTVTGVQQKLFNELAKSGRPNTMYEHSRIAVQALVEAGMPNDIARSLVAESVNSLRLMNVKNPMNIPWN